MTAGNPCIGVVYLYCDYRDQGNQNLTNIIGSLVNQLLERLSEKDFDNIYKQIEEKRKKETHPIANLTFMKDILHMVSRGFNRLFICFDAIDELETEVQIALMQSVKEIIDFSCSTETNASTETFLCFTARDHVKDMVTQRLGSNPWSVNIIATDDDIQKYIAHQLDIDPHGKLMNEDLRQQLLTQIPKISQGM